MKFVTEIKYDRNNTLFIRKEEHTNKPYKCVKIEFRRLHQKEFAVIWLNRIVNGKEVLGSRSKHGKFLAITISKDKEVVRRLQVGNTISWKFQRVNNRLSYLYTIGGKNESSTIRQS